MSELAISVLVPGLIVSVLGVSCLELPAFVDPAFFGGESFLFPAKLE